MNAFSTNIWARLYSHLKPLSMHGILIEVWTTNCSVGVNGGAHLAPALKYIFTCEGLDGWNTFHAIHDVDVNLHPDRELMVQMSAVMDTTKVTHRQSTTRARMPHIPAVLVGHNTAADIVRRRIEVQTEKVPLCEEQLWLLRYDGPLVRR